MNVVQSESEPGAPTETVILSESAPATFNDTVILSESEGAQRLRASRKPALSLSKGTLCFFLPLLLSLAAFAQHDDMPGMHMHETPTLAFASGTSWQPGSTPEHMWMKEAGGWTFMIHGQLFLTYDQSGGPRGAGKAESMNWAMFMEHHRLGKGTLQFRQMLSAEPLTTPHPGFPELFQTGETYHGQALVDHQHPHDVFGEISAQYTLPIGEKVSWLLYGGPAGEPALGPVTFLHRASASELPSAPLGHHVQDSTHISYGVFTSGLMIGKFKAEGSIFNGREPDEKRYNFDFGPMDSWSFRLSAAPSPNWTAEYSYGRLMHPEALDPGNIKRQGASIAYNRPLSSGNWATTLIWGRNHKELDGTNQNSFLLESTLNFLHKDYAFTRLELVDKDELFPQLPAPRPSYRIGAYTFGLARDVLQNRSGQIGLGADVTFYSKPPALDPFYGRSPVSLQVSVRFRPGLMSH